MELYGTPASGGAAVGRVYRYLPFRPEIVRAKLPPERVPAACRRLEEARAAAEAELEGLAAAMGDTAGGEIFRAHRALAADEDIWEEILEAVRGGADPTLALDQVFGQYAALMRANPDAGMQERAADLQDVCSRLLRNLAGLPEQNLSRLPGPVVVAAHDLLPADTATMDRKHVLASVTETGGRTSHSAILAREYGIPAVLGVRDALQLLPDGTEAAVDGTEGRVVVDPDEAVRTLFQQRREAHRLKSASDAAFLRAPCRSADGTAVEIGVNLGEDFAAGTETEPWVDLVGLFRTEFLYMRGDHLPTEEEQYTAYRRLLQAYGPKPVVLRTLDVGGDKTLPCLPLPREENPFLGKRALRLCLDREDLFTAQLRAAFRASVHGNLWIMFPMVSTPEDWRRARGAADRVRRELEAEGIPVSSGVRLGVMVETPSLAILADRIADEVDFASIGTNDLCQYTLAVDRGNPAVAGYYQMYAPAVFRLIAHVAQVFHRAGKPLCVCGELGGDEAACPALVGMGLRRLSMNAGSVAAVKRAIAGRTVPQMEALAEQVLQCATAAEVERCLKSQ